jgi:hypothetical protein
LPAVSEDVLNYETISGVTNAAQGRLFVAVLLIHVDVLPRGHKLCGAVRTGLGLRPKTNKGGFKTINCSLVLPESQIRSALPIEAYTSHFWCVIVPCRCPCVNRTTYSAGVHAGEAYTCQCSYGGARLTAMPACPLGDFALFSLQLLVLYRLGVCVLVQEHASAACTCAFHYVRS